jgi:hypothetical protein
MLEALRRMLEALRIDIDGRHHAGQRNLQPEELQTFARRDLSTEHQPEHDRFEGRRESAGGGSGLVACPSMTGS